MDAGSELARARRAAGLSQRQLAARTGTPQSAIARIEGGKQVPRIDTFERLLRACGRCVSVLPGEGNDDGVDRAQIREWLALSPAERLERAEGYGELIDELRAAQPIGPAFR